MSLFGNMYERELTQKAKMLYMYLKDRSDKEGKCWPAIKTIARDLSISESTVKRAIKELEKVGILVKEKRYRENGGITSNMYYIKLI